MPGGRSVQLDGLRGLAILMVFFHHSGVKFPHWVDWGQMGVRLFFMLTGYLITMSLWKIAQRSREAGGGHLKELGVFHLRRLARLLPAFYAAILLGAFAGLPDVVEPLWWHLGFASNFKMAMQGDFFGPTAHFWSLALQEQFYLVWPFFVLFLPRRFFPWLILGFFLVGYLYRVACISFHVPEIWRWLMLPGSADTFALGGLLAWLRTGPGLPQIPQKGWPGVMVFFALATAWFLNRWVRVADFKPWLEAMPEVFEGLVSMVLIGGCIVGWSGMVGKFFELPWLRYLGRISYGIFVYHLLLLYWFEPRLSPLGFGPGAGSAGWIWSLLMLGVVVLISGLSYRLLEQPATAWAHRVLLPRERSRACSQK